MFRLHERIELYHGDLQLSQRWPRGHQRIATLLAHARAELGHRPRHLGPTSNQQTMPHHPSHLLQVLGPAMDHTLLRLDLSLTRESLQGLLGQGNRFVHGLHRTRV